MNHKEDNWQLQTHPYPPFIPEEAEILLLGSAPPYRFCGESKSKLRQRDLNYYYGSSSNLFWDLLFGICEPEALAEFELLRRSTNLDNLTREKAIAFLQSFLTRHKLGLADILHRFKRCGESAADYQLQVLEYHDIVPLLSKNKKLGVICCTSKNRVYFWLRDYLERQEQIGLIEPGQNRDGFFYSAKQSPVTNATSG